MLRLPSIGLLPLALVATLPVVGACSSDPAPSGGAPSGVSCASSTNAGDAAAAKQALSAASSGSCVVLTASVAGPLDVPAGVSLVAGQGSRAVISGGTASEPAVTLHEGSSLHGVDVTGALGVGVAVRAASATLSDVNVSGAKGAALAVLCREGCEAGEVKLSNVSLEKSSLGLWVSGAKLSAKGGKSIGHMGQGLSAAAGVIAQDGASLSLDGMEVSGNQGAGVLIDGAKTTATLQSVNVSDNAERGVWVQRTGGTIDNPAVRLLGSTVSKNRIVGLGAVESRGIIVVGGRVGDTVAAPVVTDPATTESVGDGIGLFSNSGDVKLDNVELVANARAAGLIDATKGAIIVVGGKVQAGPSNLKFVVQGSPSDVTVPPADVSSAPTRLGVSAPTIALQKVL